MTYSFDPALEDDVSFVRFHIGDNHPEGHFLEDETIQYFINTEGWEGAVLAGIRYIITQLSVPNFVQDWLEVTNDKAREGYERILKDKQIELGTANKVIASTSISLPRRADSYQTDNNYTEIEE